MKFFWKRRPEPKFGETGLAIIVNPRAAYYLLIKRRWWDSTDREWMYEGTVLIVTNDGILQVFGGGNPSMLDESALIPVRGL